MRGIREYYARKRPGSTSLARLIEMAEIADRERAKSRRVSRRAFGFAAVAAAAALAFAMMTDTTIQKFSAPVVAQEIALNHEKNLAIEFAYESYEDLSRQMPKLDFHPIAPTLIAGAAASELLGGRYCSINGCIAAQLKLRSSDGQVHTLYQTRWLDEFDDLLGRAIDIDGVRVEFWREQNVLFGLASNR